MVSINGVRTASDRRGPLPADRPPLSRICRLRHLGGKTGGSRAGEAADRIHEGLSRSGSRRSTHTSLERIRSDTREVEGNARATGRRRRTITSGPVPSSVERLRSIYKSGDVSSVEVAARIDARLDLPDPLRFFLLHRQPAISRSSTRSSGCGGDKPAAEIAGGTGSPPAQVLGSVNAKRQPWRLPCRSNRNTWIP